MDSLPETDVEHNSPVAALAAIEAFAMFLVNLKRVEQQPITSFDQLNAHSQSEAFFAAKERIAFWRMAERMFLTHQREWFGKDYYPITPFDLLPSREQWAWFRAAQVAEAVHHATMIGDDPVRTSEIVIMQGRETRTQAVR